MKDSLAFDHQTSLLFPSPLVGLIFLKDGVREGGGVKNYVGKLFLSVFELQVWGGLRLIRAYFIVDFPIARMPLRTTLTRRMQSIHRASICSYSPPSSGCGSHGRHGKKRFIIDCPVPPTNGCCRFLVAMILQIYNANISLLYLNSTPCITSNG